LVHRRDESILVKDLPPKTEYVVRFKMSPVQHKGYLTLVTEEAMNSALTALVVFRALCNHPKIFHSVM
jgi:SNF2 family DNA or RNA helicase